MSANRSQRQVRAAILEAPVLDYVAWTLLVSCGPCDRPHYDVPISGLGGGTVGAGLLRLRCSACGGRPSRVLISNGLQGWRQRTVVLEGDGAYG